MISVIQILIIDTVRINVGISGHTDQRLCYDLIFLKYFRKEMKDHLLCQHKAARAGRNGDQTLKHSAITRNDCNFFFFIPGLQHCNCIDIFIFQKRKWLLLSYDHSGQKRLDLIYKIPFQIFTFFP